MTARVLVVDDVFANVKLLEAKLQSEYFEVLSASSGQEALDIAEREFPDIILLDVMMPGMDGFETCKKLKENPLTALIPVVMVTALDQPADRVRGLEAGADDFLTKPVRDIALFARVRSLVRLKVMMEELRNRERTGEQIGYSNSDAGPTHLNLPHDSRVLVVDDRERTAKRMRRVLENIAEFDFHSDTTDIIRKIEGTNYDLIIVNLGMHDIDGLRICSQFRNYEHTRYVPILVMVDDGNIEQLARAMEIGVNDYVVRPVDQLEFQTRVKTQLKRKAYADRLWKNFHTSMKMATTDSVTGLYNRHYMTNHLETQLETSYNRDKNLSIMIIDIDHFKKVNDTYGHTVGDQVLAEFGDRLLYNVRGVDLASRFGGEEFVVMMPDTSIEEAEIAAERLRRQIEAKPFTHSDGKTQIPMTVSIGVGTTSSVRESGEDIFKRIDKAMFAAKDAGRNQTVTAKKPK